MCAVVPRELELGAQSRLVDSVVRINPGVRGITDGIATAMGTGADWIWLLDGGVSPRPDALAQLLRPLEVSLPAGPAAVLASKVLGVDGRLDREAPPWPRMLAREAALDGAEHRLMVIRAARYGSLLVDRRAIVRHGGPRPDFFAGGDDLEWTGRVLRDQAGYLVPQSIVTRTAAPVLDRHAYTRNRVRILRGDGWSGQERAWFAFLLASDVARGAAARPAAALGMLRAMVSGLRSPP